MLTCISIHVKYHPPKQSGLIPGVAICLNRCLQLLDQHGVPHQSEDCIRKELRQSKLAATRMKQYFRKGVTGSSSQGAQEVSLHMHAGLLIPLL